MSPRAVCLLLWVLLPVARPATAAATEESCPRKELGPNVKVLAKGSKVMLSCHGNVIVDGVDVTQTTRAQAESVEGDHRGERDVLESTSRKGYGVHSTVTSEVRGGMNMATVTASQPGVTKKLSRVSHHLTSITPTAHTDMEGATKGASTSSVNLSNGATTGGVVRSLNQQVQWKRNNRPLYRKDHGGNLLYLGPLNSSKSGNYTCHLEKRIIFSVKIIVWDPLASLEKPSLSCYSKSPTSKIRCEWTASKPMVPVPQCHLVLKKGILGENVKKSCFYSEAKSRCWCVLDIEDRTNSYMAFLCVSSIIGNVTSPLIDLNRQNIVKPDRPYNVSVHEKEGEEHKLIVSWRKPTTWRADFYQLMYQLHYSVSLDGELKGRQEIFTKKLEHTITDALPETQYVLQVRAREEFDLGQWSEWSTHVYTPSRRDPDPSSTNNPMVSFDTDKGNVWCSEGSGMDDNENMLSVSEHPQLESQLLLHISWAIGAGLLLMIMVLFAYIIRLRHRTQFMCKLPKLSHSSQSKATSSPSSPPPKEENPLVNPEPLGPTPDLDSNFFQEEAEKGEGIHLNNMGYFLTVKD